MRHKKDDLLPERFSWRWEFIGQDAAHATFRNFLLTVSVLDGGHVFVSVRRGDTVSTRTLLRPDPEDIEQTLDAMMSVFPRYETLLKEADEC